MYTEDHYFIEKYQKHEHCHKCPPFSMTLIILVSLLHVQSVQSLSDAMLMELKRNNIAH